MVISLMEVGTGLEGQEHKIMRGACMIDEILSMKDDKVTCKDKGSMAISDYFSSFTSSIFIQFHDSSSSFEYSQTILDMKFEKETDLLIFKSLHRVIVI